MKNGPFGSRPLLLPMEILDQLHAFPWRDPTSNNCNTYLISTGEKHVLIDPGHDHLFGHVQEQLSRLTLSPGDIDLVIITHAHPDHMEAVRRFHGTAARIAMLGVEAELVRELAPHYGDALGEGSFEPHILLQEGELNIGAEKFQILHTPGHSPGSLCLYWPVRKALFTGDVLFHQGVGRTDLPGGDGARLKESIRRLSRLDAEYVLPGHGDIIAGRERVRASFDELERIWFAYL